MIGDSFNWPDGLMTANPQHGAPQTITNATDTDATAPPTSAPPTRLEYSIRTRQRVAPLRFDAPGAIAGTWVALDGQTDMYCSSLLFVVVAGHPQNAWTLT